MSRVPRTTTVSLRIDPVTATEWRDRAASALLPVARVALGDRTDAVMADVVQQFNARMAKAGVAL